MLEENRYRRLKNAPGTGRLLLEQLASSNIYNLILAAEPDDFGPDSSFNIYVQHTIEQLLVGNC